MTRLDERPLPRLLHEAHQSRLTGTLTLTTATGAHRVFVRDGYPVAVAGAASAGDRLGELLVAAGALTTAACERALATHDGRRLGERLVGDGRVGLPAVAEALRAQVRRRLHALFALEDAEVQVQASAHDEGSVAGESLRIHPRRSIYQGVRALWPPSRVGAALEAVARTGARVQLRPDVAPAQYKLSVADAALAEVLAAAACTIDEHARATGDAAGARALLAVFHHTDALRVTPSARAATVEIASLAGAHGGGTRPTAETLAVAARTVDARPTMESPAWVAAGPAATRAAPQAPASGALETARRALLEKAATVETDSFYTVLGVARDASEAAIGEAYLAQVKLHHPDRLTTRGLGDLSAEATRIFRRLTDARATLTDGERRAQYDRELDGGAALEGAAAEKQKADAAEVRRILDAEMAFREGEALLRQRQFPLAVVALARAVALSPDEGEHRALHAWARFAAGQATHAEIRPELERAIKSAPRCARAHHYLGIVRRELGDEVGAVTSFRRAIELDSRLQEAQTELRVLEARRARRR